MMTVSFVKYFSCRIVCILLFAACTLAGADAPAKTKQVSAFKSPTKDMAGITAVLTRLAVSQHYAGKVMDVQFSEMAFDNYMKQLDPLKLFFLQSDIENFSVNRSHLGEDLLKGDVSFAFKAFNLMAQRMREYRDFTHEFLKSSPDLNTDETFSLERDKGPWPVSREEMRQAWRKKLLNELILLNLADRAIIEEERLNPPKKEDSAEKEEKKKTPEERILQRVDRTCRHFEEMEPIEVLEVYLTSVLQVLDPHSSYMSPHSDEEFDISMKLSLVGIGAVLTTEDGYTKIVEIMPGGPADKQGELKANDRIIAVRQENEKEAVDVIDMPLNKVVSLIRGKEQTKVTLTVLKAGTGLSSPCQITITRAKIELKASAASGEIRTFNGRKFGVITLPSFYLDFNAAKLGSSDYRSASMDVKKIILDFKKTTPDMAGLVMDLRSNGGGSLREAVALTGLFIKDGPVVQVRDRKETEVDSDDDGGEIVYDGPLAVLTNRFSASASEIFAAAIRDYNRGIIIGDLTTHGKGTVQFVCDLDRYMPYIVGRRFKAGAIRLTNAKFYRINGESTQLKGIPSDIVLPALSGNMEAGEDKLEHCLAWDTIPNTQFRKFEGPAAMNDTLRAELRKRSEKRVAESLEFKKVNQVIDEYNKIKNRKSVALNLDLRWKEYQELKDLQKRQEELADSMSGSRSSKKEKKDKTNDIYVEEALNVLQDIVTRSK